jgi:hypothetical protein
VGLRTIDAVEVAEVGTEPLGMSEGVGQAVIAEGAAAAPWREQGGREALRVEQVVEPGDGGLGVGAECRGELNLTAGLALFVVDGAAGHDGVEHFLEAEGLGAELDVVVVPASLAAAFVLDGQGDLDGGRAASFPPGFSTELDEVGPPVKPEPPRGDPKPAFGADALAFLEPGAVGTGVEDVAAEGMLVVDVEAVEVPEGGAAVAIQQGVEGGEGDEVVPLGVGGGGHGLGFTWI